MEAIEGIKTYQTDREQIKQIGMIKPMIDSVAKAIEAQNLPLFKKQFRQFDQYLQRLPPGGWF